MRRAARGTVILAAIAVGTLAWGSLTWPSLRAEAQSAVEGEYGQQQRGKYLAAVGDCVACHTAEGGKPMAGGRPIGTPFGVIYSPNITPDPQTGLGAWTSDQFYRAMHNGVADDGSNLYPAFPYPWFTKATRDDVDAIFAYLRTLPPVKYARPDNKFPWPLNNRIAMDGWNALYFKAGSFAPDSSKSAEWNRGAYLVQGLAHCGACHSPKNSFGAVEDSERFDGSEIDHWFAPNLTGNQRFGIGSWSEDMIVQFLKTGHTDHAIAYGPMGQVVRDSTSKLTDVDLRNIAIFLKSLPASSNGETPARPAQGVAEAGAAIYGDVCSACHQAHGQGVAGLFPALKGNPIVQSEKPTTVLRLILNGGHAVSTVVAPTSVSMPSFGWKLSDQEIAAVASFIRSAWGNVAAPVSSGDVRDLRSAVQNVSSAD